MVAARMQIGEVAERTGLSQRTIRYYGEVDLVVPSSRTDGGFRLYTDADVAKLQIIKKMKPLGYSLEQMGEVLSLLAELQNRPAAAPRSDLTDRLAAIRAEALRRRDELAAHLAAAESFIDQLDQRTGAQPR